MAATLAPLQEQSIREATGRVNVWSGAIRSGKTIGSLLRWLMFVATAPTSGELVMTGRTRDAVWRNVIGPLQDPELFGLAAAHVVGNIGAPTVTILGRRIHVIGASDAKAEAVIRGMTVAGCYVDELTTLPEAFFTQLLGRMSVRGAQAFCTTNPDSPAHWLKVKFLDRIGDLPDWRLWHFILEDNPALTESYKASIRSEFTGLWFRRFVLGEWVAAEGAVFDMWIPERHVVPWSALPRMERLLGVGIDYGTTNATSAIVLGQAISGRLFLVDEWRFDPAKTQHRLTDSQISASITTWLTEKHLPQTDEPTIEWIVVDPAAASLKAQLQADGLRRLANADNDVSYGIRTMSSLLSGAQLLIADRCSGLVTEIPGYSWDPKASEQGQDRPIKTADHSIDAARYAIASTESAWRKNLPAITPTSREEATRATSTE